MLYFLDSQTWQAKAGINTAMSFSEIYEIFSKKNPPDI